MKANVAAESFAFPFIAGCQSALQQLITDVPDVLSALISSMDGFELASAGRKRPANSRMAALSSSMLAVSQASMREMRLEGTGSLLIENDAGKLLIMEARLQPHGVVLSVGADHRAVTGKLLWAARRCVESLGE